MNIGVIIFLVIMVGGWIIKAINAANEAKQKKGSPPDRSGRPQMDYEALAERRRQELQQQAQQRRAQQGRRPQAQAPQRDPATMSMAERIEMARRRSSQQRGSSPQVDQQAQALQQAREEAQANADAQQRAQRIRQEQAARQRQEQQRRQQQHQKRVQQQSQPPPGRAATQRAAAGTQRDMSQVSKDAKRKHEQSHDRVLSKQESRAAKLQENRAWKRRSKGAKALLDFSKLNRRSLRQAIVLKEILDAPVALRDNPRY